MTDTCPPRLALYFMMLFAAQTILFPLLALESSALVITLGG